MKELIALTVVRLAALRAPAHQRDELLTEWRAEILRELRRENRWSVVRSAFGAFADARARRTIDRAGRRTKPDGLLITWMQSLGVSARSLLRAPGFAIICFVTLAIGLGSSGAIFTLVDRIVLDPLPYPDADRLVSVENQVPGVAPDEIWWLSTAQWVYYTEHASDLEQLGIYNEGGLNVITASGPLHARSVWATREILPLLGATTLHGRLLSPTDDEPGAEQVAVVSHSFWRDHLGSDPDPLGSTLTLDRGPVAIVGVLSEDVRLPRSRFIQAPEIWLAQRIDRGGTFHNSHRFQGLGLLRDGVRADEVQVQLAGLRDQLPERFEQAYSQRFFDQYGFRTTVEPLLDAVVGETASTLWILFGGVGLVLLIACANVANLFIVRMEGRRRELALRVALGAERSDVGRYVLSDGLVLAVGGGLLGLIGAGLMVPALITLAPEGIPRLEGVALGADSVVFTIAVSLGVALLVSAWPLVSGTHVVAGLRAGGRTASGSRAQNRLRNALVSGQIALAMSLLVGAGLLLQTVRTLRAVDPGFDAEGVVTMDVYASAVRYPDDVALWAFHREVLDRVGAIGGVVSVGMGEEVPVDGEYGCTVQGSDDESIYDRLREQGLTTCAGQTRVAPGYFETLGIPLVEGRLIEAADNDDPNRAAVVVSEAFAERFWPGESPIGRGLGPSGRTIPPFYYVVGVVGDVAKSAADGRPPLADPAMAVYYPGVYQETENRWGGWWPGRMKLIVRVDGEASRLVPEIRRVIREIDPEAPLSGPELMSDVVAEATGQVTFVSTLLLLTAATALLLAAVGLYGVVSWVVTRRTREIGTRLAVGAHPGWVVREVVRDTMRLAVVGLVLGIPLAALTSSAGRAVLVGVSPTTPTAYLAATLTVTAVALGAAWLPARRAAKVDPATALRAE